MAFYSTMKQSTLRLALAFGLALFFCLSAVLAQTTVGVEVLGYAADPAGLGRQTANVVVTTEPITGQAIVIGTLESTEPGEQIYLVSFTPEGEGQSPACYQVNASQFDATESQMPTFIGVAVAVGSGDCGVPAPEPPAAPANLVATAGDASVGLAWDAVSGALTYNVYRGVATGEETLLASDIATNSYTDATAENGTEYFYTVTAVNAGGESDPSNEDSATPAFDPLALPLIVWLDGKVAGSWTVADTDKITQWADQSGNNNHFTSSGASRPTLAVDRAVFAGSQSLSCSMGFGDAEANSEIAAVLYAGNPGEGQQVVMGGVYSGGAEFSGRVTYNVGWVYDSVENDEGYFDSASFFWGLDSGWINGTPVEFPEPAFRPTPTFDLDALFVYNEIVFAGVTAQVILGRDTITPDVVPGLNGGIAEVMFFSRALTTEERTNLQAYLLAKWSITP